jgi:hypothetical protein
MEGSYSIDSKLGRIDFAFDCEVDFDGKKVQKLTEEFEINNYCHPTKFKTMIKSSLIFKLRGIF